MTHQQHFIGFCFIERFQWIKLDPRFVSSELMCIIKCVGWFANQSCPITHFMYKTLPCHHCCHVWQFFPNWFINAWIKFRCHQWPPPELLHLLQQLKPHQLLQTSPLHKPPSQIKGLLHQMLRLHLSQLDPRLMPPFVSKSSRNDSLPPKCWKRKKCEATCLGQQHTFVCEDRVSLNQPTLGSNLHKSSATDDCTTCTCVKMRQRKCCCLGSPAPPCSQVKANHRSNKEGICCLGS